LKISCPEEIAYYKGFINRDLLIKNASRYGNSGYGRYLSQLVASSPPQGLEHLE
jgi:glucose-1-phosphate thymidylyltransferase